MNQNVVNYLQENKDKYAQDVLVTQLRITGYSEADIAEGIFVVYENSGAPIPAMQIKYAGFWVRYAASLIDGMIVIIPMFILGLVFALVSIGGLADLESEGSGIFLRLFVSVLVWIYFIVMTKNYGATLGKKAMGIKVISDKSENLSWGQVILRETLGKIISTIILYIGYLMAGFTARKQALHDMMASTVVVYKDPNDKPKSWIIVLVIVIPFILAIIIGIFASITLVSLNSARGKAQDASIKTIVSSVIPSAIIYQSEKGSLVGFVPDFGTSIQGCSGKPSVNISPDGQKMAIFAKLCSSSTTYFCVDLNSNSTEVNQVYAMSGKTDCGVKK